MNIPRELASHASRSGFFFVQVGANDGRLDDPIHDLICEHDWQGVLVEPLPWVFERLLRTYVDRPRLRFECCAIAFADGVRTMWHLPRDVAESPTWDLSVLATTVRSNFTHPLCLDVRDAETLAPLLQSLQVPAITLQRLVGRHGIRHIDLLQVDAQGDDFEILSSLSFDEIKPTFINYEHALLGDSRSACEAFLRARGYRLETGLDARHDTLAILSARL